MSDATQPTSLDRIGAAFRALVRGEDPRRTFSAIYEFTVADIALDGSTADVTPDDTTIGLPPLVQVKLRLPFLTGKIAIGQRCLVFFVNGDPTRPAILAADPVPTQSALDATTEVDIGASAGLVSLAGGADFVSLAAKVTQRLAEFAGSFMGAVPVPNDGGAAIQSTVKTALALAGWTVPAGVSPTTGAAKVKAT